MLTDLRGLSSPAAAKRYAEGVGLERVARVRAPRAMGPFSTAASFSPVEIRSHNDLGFLSSCYRRWVSLNPFHNQRDRKYFLVKYSCVWFCSLSKASPLRACGALAAQTYIRPGITRPKVPHARAPRAMGPFSTAASFSPVEIRSHIHLGFHKLLLSVLGVLTL